MYHFKDGKAQEDVDLSMPLSYADRFRMRNPGSQWVVHPPHVDGQPDLILVVQYDTLILHLLDHTGGAIERWEDETYRSCFAEILNGDWRNHDPYDVAGRIRARTSMYGKENQASIQVQRFRSRRADSLGSRSGHSF